MSLLLSIALACSDPRVPEDADFFDVTVTAADISDPEDGIADNCHDGEQPGYEKVFHYALTFNASSADVYAQDDQGEWFVFAVGSATGCDLSYQTVVIGEETESDGEVKWQLFGQASFDKGDNQCVEDEADWSGTEWYKIVSSVDETLEPGCEYEMVTSGKFVPQE